ncbi:MAG: hypothetical protein U0R80_10115 [Nocardioidaceae bacterium]
MSGAQELALEEALAAFRQTLEEARAHVARVAATPVHTAEQRAELERDALSGRLGPEMRQIAERVEARETSWGEVFEGSSPWSDLLLPHLTAMGERYADRWRVALQEDPDFEPLVEADRDRGPSSGPLGWTP